MLSIVNISPWDVRELSPPDLPDVMALQALILKKLPEGKKNFILPKSEAEFYQRMTEWGRMVGVFASDGLLIGYANAVFPRKNWPIADMRLEIDELPCSWNDLGVNQSTVVHPAFRGYHLQRLQISLCEELCLRKGRLNLMAEVAAANYPSLSNFMALGYRAVHATLDKNDGARVLQLHKKAGREESCKQKAPILIDPTEAFDVAKELLDKGYVGQTVTRNNRTDQHFLHLVKPAAP